LRGRVIALYVSGLPAQTATDRRILAVLRRHLGTQFAGQP